MQRRHVLSSGAAAGAGLGLGATPLRAQESITWTMAMTWPINTPGLGTNAQKFAERVTAMSNGRLNFNVYGAGELVPAFETLDAVQGGTADIAHSTPYYWVGKAPALNYFTGVPYGLTAAELAGWLRFGGGMELWRETYADFGVIPLYAGNSRTQAGGWFRGEITSLADLEGLKFRIAGLGGEVMRRLGVNTVLLPPGEIGPALMSGTVDAAEWVGPWNDRAFGLYQSAKFYYVPAFHEVGPGLEIIVNRERYEALPDDLKAILEVAAQAIAEETTADFTFHNIEALEPLLEEHDVELRTWPEDVVEALGRTTLEVLDELAATDELTRRIHDNMFAYLKRADRYATAFDQRILAQRTRALAQG